MKVIETQVEGVKLIEPNVFGDQRGFSWKHSKSRYKELLGIDVEFVQDNHSRSARGVLRGLHFQTAKPQGKLVRVVRGEVYDVVVDIRPDSPTFKNGLVFTCLKRTKPALVPPGLAHGFVVVSTRLILNINVLITMIPRTRDA